jgi:hypothetical protein
VVTGTRGIQKISIRQGDWKMILEPESGKYWLFDLLNDPLEKKDLSQVKLEVCSELRSLLDTYLSEGCSRPEGKGEATSFEDLYKERDRRNREIKMRFTKKLN